MSSSPVFRSDWAAAGRDASAFLDRLSKAARSERTADAEHPAGPTTNFMAFAQEAEAAAERRGDATGVSLKGEHAQADEPMLPPRSLPERAVAHLDAALRHDRDGVSRGWEHFETHWEEGRALQGRLALACLAAGPGPCAAIQDEISGQWFSEKVDLTRAVPTAHQVVGDMLEIYEAIGVGALLMPECRRHPEYAPTVVLASVLAVLDAREIARPLAEVLRREGWFEPVLWSRAQTPRSLGQLLEFLASPALRRMLGRTVGARRAARHYARMMTRLIPGLGRKLLQADVLWLVFEQWNAPAEPPLRSLQSRQPRQPALRPTFTGLPR